MTQLQLPARWHKVCLDPRQKRYLESTATINYVHAGRRAFKTEAAKRRVVWRACFECDHPSGRYFACAPTQQQAEDIFWKDLKALSPPWMLRTGDDDSINESDCTIEYVTGAVLKVAGLDKPQRIEGGFWDGGVVSEYAECKARVFSDHILPMLLRGGWIDLESVPEGRNHFHEEVQEANARIGGGDTDIAVHHWPTWDVLHLYLGEEKAAKMMGVMARSMDEITLRQECGGEFLHFSGRAYYNFNVTEHVRRCRYDPSAPLDVCFDFNVDPGTCVYCQEQLVDMPGFPRGERVTVVLGEVHIPRASNTPMVCRKVIEDWKGGDGEPPAIAEHRGEVRLFGDPAGGQRSTKYEHGNDWTIIRSMLNAAFGEENVSMQVPRQAPRVRARVNAMNSRMIAADGVKRMMFHPRAKETIKDIDLTRVKKGSAGELDDENGKRGHLGAGLGYRVVRVGKSVSEMQEEAMSSGWEQ